MGRAGMITGVMVLMGFANVITLKWTLLILKLGLEGAIDFVPV